jgi:clan AA aspartic protease (TIGR02281 family)
MRSGYIFILFLIFFCTLLQKINADIVHLENGRDIEGLVKAEDSKGIDLEVGFGTMRIAKTEILSIDKSVPQETDALRQKWEKARSQAKSREQDLSLKEALQPTRPPEHVTEESIPSSEEAPRKEFKPKEIDIQPTGGHILVDALINRKARASLLLDTGASLIVLSKRLGKELGVDTSTQDGEGVVPLILADGRTVDTKYVRLDSLAVEGQEVTNLDAAVLLDDSQDSGFGDGLLGLSFLNSFNFKVDQENGKLILERFER